MAAKIPFQSNLEFTGYMFVFKDLEIADFNGKLDHQYTSVSPSTLIELDMPLSVYIVPL